MTRRTCTLAGQKDLVQYSLLVRNIVISAALGFLLGAVTLFVAGEPSACRWTKANAFRSAGDRYRAQQDYSTAARWYLAATRVTRGCRSMDASILGARSLADAGTMYAQSRYSVTFSRLNLEQSQVRSDIVPYVRTAKDAQSSFNLAERIVRSINELTQSMRFTGTDGDW